MSLGKQFELQRRAHNSQLWEPVEYSSTAPEYGDDWYKTVKKYPDLYRIMRIERTVIDISTIKR